MNKIKAFFFDQDGVIIDTERDGHRVSFNKTFKEFGFNFEWNEEEYHELLQIGGGKERITHYLNTKGFRIPVKKEDQEELIKSLHKRKTEIFMKMLEADELPLRPGILRIMREINQLDLKLGICTTSAVKTATLISEKLLTGVAFDFIIAGDMVKKKKPDPEIYLLAMEKLGLKPDECVVIEDSEIGTKAAKQAGCYVLCTINDYTKDEDLSNADIIINNLGDENAEKALILKGRFVGFNGSISAEMIVNTFNT